MKFQIYDHNYNVPDLIRRISYRPIGTTPAGELNCVRPLGADYPRFHIYLIEKPDIITFSIHLDQKKPSYEGATAHGGDYESDVVKAEIERIQDKIFR